MTPTSLSQWADRNGIPRRTAYNWAKSGKLNVPLHKTLTGRLMVLDDEDPAELDVHPFISAYAESLGSPISDRTRYLNHSPLLEAWGVSLYDAVAGDLRPTVLQLAQAAACERSKKDADVRFSDWIGRVEFGDWYASVGLAEVAAMVRQRPPITDGETFRDYWPTCPNSMEFAMEIDAAVKRAHDLAGISASRDGGAAELLAEGGVGGAELVQIAGRRENLRKAIGDLEKTTPGGYPLPDWGELWDLKAYYSEPMWAIARPATRQTAHMICELMGYDPDAPAPASGHPLRELGYSACVQAAKSALVPHEHAAHVREIDAFRRIALGKPFIPAYPR